MKTQITIKCPSCLSFSIKKNGWKIYGKQNYQCKDCHRQFIHDSELKYKGCQSFIEDKIRLMLVRGCSIADIVAIEKVSKYKVLSVLVQSDYQIKPKRRYYRRLQVYEFWTYVGCKRNKVWLVYAYDPDTNEIVTFVWGKRNLTTAKQLRAKLEELGVDFGYVCCDNWDSFLTAFGFDFKKVSKYYTVDIEGNNNLFRHRMRRAFRKTCCFSKKLTNHFKAFDLLFHYVNYGWV